jgi:phospholipid transport system substrate-binding protein
MRATVILAFLLCLVFGSAPLLAYGDDKANAGAFADELGHKALAVISDSKLSKQAKLSKLETLFQQNVDIDWIGKFVLGRFWRGATESQKQQYLVNYKKFLIRHYTSNLTEFTNADFQVTKVTPEDQGAPANQGGFVVSMRIKRPEAEDTLVDYTVRKADGGFKVYDIIVEGVSMITTQRSEFASVASQQGVDYLIAQLERRSQPGSAGDAAQQ